MKWSRGKDQNHHDQEQEHWLRPHENPPQSIDQGIFVMGCAVEEGERRNDGETCQLW